MWYGEGKKLSKFFLNLQKRRGIQGKITNNQEIKHQNRIQNELLFFYETLFKNTSANTSEEKVSVPKLNYEDARICQGDLNELELLKALKSMQNNKSPGNDGLTKEFTKHFRMK